MLDIIAFIFLTPIILSILFAIIITRTVLILMFPLIWAMIRIRGDITVLEFYYDTLIDTPIILIRDN